MSKCLPSIFYLRFKKKESWDGTLLRRDTAFAPWKNQRNSFPPQWLFTDCVHRIQEAAGAEALSPWSSRKLCGFAVFLFLLLYSACYTLGDASVLEKNCTSPREAKFTLGNHYASLTETHAFHGDKSTCLCGMGKKEHKFKIQPKILVCGEYLLKSQQVCIYFVEASSHFEKPSVRLSKACHSNMVS